jgi:tetratricopeptide (TPR) repeat protein
MAAEIHAQKMNPELMKAAQNLPFDTLCFCVNLDKAMDYYQKSHEADITPDKKGNVKPKFVKANHDRVLSMIDYYNYAAVFANGMGKQDMSLNYFAKYLDMPNSSLFTASEKDSLMAVKKDAYLQTARNMAILYYQEKNHEQALKYSEMALKDTENLRDLFIIKSQSHLAMGDTTAWLNTLVNAADRTGEFGFMQNILHHYVTKGDLEDARKMAADMEAKAPESKNTWYMKGCVELNMANNYPAARECFKKALEIDPDFVEANANMAFAHTNEAVFKYQNGGYKILGTGVRLTSANKALYDKELAEFTSFYKNALPYMEKVRSLKPDSPRDWAYALQKIYDNLSMKAEKAEMDSIIKNMR